MKNLTEIKNTNKVQLVESLLQKNIKGGIGCPPPIGGLRGAGDPPPFGI